MTSTRCSSKLSQPSFPHGNTDFIAIHAHRSLYESFRIEVGYFNTKVELRKEEIHSDKNRENSFTVPTLPFLRAHAAQCLERRGKEKERGGGERMN